MRHTVCHVASGMNGMGTCSWERAVRRGADVDTVESKPAQDAFRSVVRMGQRIGRGAQYLLAIPLALSCRLRLGDAVAVYGFYGGIDRVNLGDEAICDGMLLRLRQLGHPIWLVNEEGRDDYAGVERVFGSNRMIGHWVRWIQVIRGARVFVIGGGGLFQDYGTSQGVPRGLAMIELLFWIAGRPCVWYSVGVGPLTTGQGRFFTKFAASLSSRLTVRDTHSAEMLKATLGVRKPVEVTADAALDLQTGARISSCDSLQRPVKTIGISAFGFYDVVYHDRERNNNLVHVYSDLITVCISRGYEVKLLCMDSQQDWSFWSEVRLQVANNEPRLEIVRTTNLDEMMHTMSTLDALLGMRFHSVLLGAMVGTPLGIVTYHPKVASLARSMQHDRYTLPLSEVSGDNLVGLLDDVLDQRYALAAAELSWASEQRQYLARNSQDVEALYEGTGN